MEAFWNVPSLIAGVMFILTVAAIVMFRIWRNKRHPVTENQPVVSASATPVQPAKYPAMVFDDRKGIVFTKLPDKLGNDVYLEPSMPRTGFFSLCVTKDGGTKAYDPREAPLLSKDTPQRAYRAIKWPTVQNLYHLPAGFMEKVNAVLIGLIIMGAFIVTMVAIDKVAGG